MHKTYAVINLGCKVNRVEADHLEIKLSSKGLARADVDAADVVIVNTCTVTAEAEKKTRKAIRQALKRNAKAMFFVTGCACAISPSTYASLDSRVHVMTKLELAEWIDSIPDAADESRARAEDLHLRSRRGILVQDGCDNACTYCIVCKARGRSRSIPAHEVISQAVMLADAGTKEIILTGINLGAYEYEGLKLDGLLNSLLKETEALCDVGDVPLRFRVSSVEPPDVSDDLIDMIALSNGRICAHLHLPLQSGSDEVLSRMERNYTAEQFTELVASMRRKLPSLSLTTDIICGFPGETEEDFKRTLEVARESAFSKIHVFPYSRREGTLAATFSDQIASEVKMQRAKTLRELSDELRVKDAKMRYGREEFFLVQENGRMMSESYFEMDAPKDAPIGKLVKLPFDLI